MWLNQYASQQTFGPSYFVRALLTEMFHINLGDCFENRKIAITPHKFRLLSSTIGEENRAEL